MQKQEKWYQKTIWIIILLCVFFPVGLFLMWKYSNWNRCVKAIISVVFAVLVLGAALNSDTTDTTSESQPLVSQSQEVTEETPKAAIDKIKDKYQNADISISGSVLYIKDNLKHSKRDYYHSEAKEVYNYAHNLLDEIPGEVDTICVWYNTEFIDKLGNETTDTAYRINMTVDTLKSINWDNYIGLDFEALSNGDMYAWAGLK